jgi:hypothetical protein
VQRATAINRYIGIDTLVNCLPDLLEKLQGDGVEIPWEALTINQTVEPRSGIFQCC